MSHINSANWIIPIIGEINEMLITAERAKSEKEEATKYESDDSKEYKNSETIIVDAACALSQISYPQDVSLLNNAQVNHR